MSTLENSMSVHDRPFPSLVLMVAHLPSFSITIQDSRPLPGLDRLPLPRITPRICASNLPEPNHQRFWQASDGVAFNVNTKMTEDNSSEDQRAA